MIYIVFSILVTALIYINVLGMWKGIGEIPEGPYKEKLWKFKKMEIIEKGIISLLFTVVIISMKFTEEVALVSLVVMAIMLTVENLLARTVRKGLVCPHCGGPLWTGNYIVLLRPRKWCPHCSAPLVEMPKASEETEETEEIETDETEQ